MLGRRDRGFRRVAVVPAVMPGDVEEVLVRMARDRSLVVETSLERVTSE